jgi:serine/threonine protein kinase, bacterial
LVVAPLGSETVMATGTALPKSSPPFGAAVGAGMPGAIRKGVMGLGRSLLVVLLLAGAGALGWMGVRGWIQYQFNNPLMNNKPTPQQTKDYSSNEKQRKAQLINRLERSGVSSSFFYRVANEAYYVQYPDQRGHLLSNGPEDASLRSNWDRVGTQVLDLSEQLSSSTRARLGRYTARDRIQQVQQLRAAQVDVRQFEQDATSRLTEALPMYKGVDLRNTLAFQLLNGLAADRIQRVNAGGNP